MNRSTKKTIVAALLIAIGGVVAFTVYNRLQGINVKHPVVRSPLDYSITAEAISSRFGEKRGNGNLHNGIDIRTRELAGVPTLAGTPTVGLKLYVPFAECEVLEAFFSDTGGNSLRIKSPDGYIMGFAHLLTVVVNPGDRLVAGDLLGACGNSGLPASGKEYAPHLHLTMRDPSGSLVDPAPFFGV